MLPSERTGVQRASADAPAPVQDQAGHAAWLGPAMWAKSGKGEAR